MDDVSKELANGPAASADQNRKVTEKPKVKAIRAKFEREQSSIQFPYMDLESAVSVARAILTGGGVPLTRDQLAGVMNLASGSGNFVQKVATSRLFGLVSFVGGKYELTDLGFNILDSDEKRQRGARAGAFLSVPLYRRTYDEFKGKQLPPRPHGLEQAFVTFGVAPKQKANARYAFEKAAAQAGFFPNGPDRLIEPIIGAGKVRFTGIASATSTATVGSLSVERTRSTTEENNSDGENGRTAVESSAPETRRLHPFIQGLLASLPEPDTNWTVDGRAKWLQAAANIFDLMYKGSGEIHITVKDGQKPKE
jgi:hypothetical protein